LGHHCEVIGIDVNDRQRRPNRGDAGGDVVRDQQTTMEGLAAPQQQHRHTQVAPQLRPIMFCHIVRVRQTRGLVGAPELVPVEAG
jgi:hypothetical protein